MIEAFVSRQQAIDQRVAGGVATSIIARVAILETVRHDEVEDIILSRHAHARSHQELITWLESTGHIDSNIISCRIVSKSNQITIINYSERHIAGGIGSCPVLIKSDFKGVITGWDMIRGEGIDTIAVDILHPGAQTPWLPIVRATDLRLEAAGNRGNDRIEVFRYPVALMI
ncbi:MAG: hypothetical protein PVF74_10645, partial [Anaerolineales bacterium]